MMEPHDSEEITSLNIDKDLDYLYDSEKEKDPTWIFLQQAQKRDFNHKFDNLKYKLPEPREFHSFSSNIYNNYKNIQDTSITISKQWQLLYRVLGKVFWKKGFFAELYFNIVNHNLLLVIKGTSSIGNLWSDIKNVGLGLKGGELNSAFTFGEKVRVLMNEFKCKPMLLITGHSLGGYLAQIITYTITYCFVENGKVMSRSEPMDDFGIYTMVFDSPAALKQISSIDPRDPKQTERFRLPIVNFIVDVNIINSNKLTGGHLGQVISVKQFGDLNVPNMMRWFWNFISFHGIKNFENIDLTQCKQVVYLPRKKTVKYEEKEIHPCIFSAKNCERLRKYLNLDSMDKGYVKGLPKFTIEKSTVILQDKNVSPNEFIMNANRFLSQFKDDIDIHNVDGQKFRFWTDEMMKDAHKLILNEERIQQIQNWKDGTKIGGFESYEEMRFVGCMLHNSIPRCLHYDYKKYFQLDKEEVDQFKTRNAVTLILIMTNENQNTPHTVKKRVKIIYLVLDSSDDEKITLNLSALDVKSQEQLKNTQLQFMGNKVRALDIFGNKLVENLKIWEIYNSFKDAVQPPTHFYTKQDISSENQTRFSSAVVFARELMKKKLKFVLISSNAGMGKSTALKQIALTLQQELRNHWIVHINLKDIQSELLSAKDKLNSKDAAVEFVRNTELEKSKDVKVLAKVFNFKFLDNKMVFLFDSLDEVCPIYRDTVEKLVALLKETQLQIVLTTRPNEGKNFITAKVFELQPLDRLQRRNFIRQKFKILGKKPPSDPEKWLRYINYFNCNNDFWSLPLNLKIATSMYDADIAESSGLEGKTNFYEKFLSKSIDDTMKIKYKLDKDDAAGMPSYTKKVNNLNELFEDLAVCLIFHSGEISKSNDLKEKLQDRENVECIIRSDVATFFNECKRVSFHHRSYAEYLLARAFFNCHQNDQRFKLSSEQLVEIYLKPEFVVVLKHVCGILAALPSPKMNFDPLITNALNKTDFLKVLIKEDCYELYKQIKEYVKFSFKYSNSSPSHYNPLYLALLNARKEFVQQIKKDGAKFEDVLNENGVLHLAIEKGLHQEVQDHFESLKSNMDKKQRGKLPLHFAAQYASGDMVEFLIKNGADVDAKNGSEKTALYFAIKTNNAEVCKLLIEKGADCKKALEYAALFGRKEMFDEFYKTTPDECRSERVKNAHFDAVKYGNLDIFNHISGFLEADPLAFSSTGDTFLHCAAQHGHLHCMSTILKYMKIWVDVKSSNGKTALMTAMYFNQGDVVEWFLKQYAAIRAVKNRGHATGTNVNRRDGDGESALFPNLMGKEVSGLDNLTTELVENLTIWEISEYHAHAVTTPRLFYSKQEISGKSKNFKSAIAFARELMKKDMQFVMISSDAGMGKSTALRQIALTLKQKLKDNWIVHINLLDITPELGRAKEKLTSMDAAVEFVRNIVLAGRNDVKLLIAKVFNWIWHEKKIIFLFDSLDEVCPYHRETVEKLIAILIETQFQIVLTTRPHEGNDFENAHIFKLKPLDRRQRRSLIRQKFKISNKIPPSDPEKWLRQINYNACSDDFWSWPSNLNLATSMYDTDADIALAKEERGNKNICKVFLTNSIENTLTFKFNLKKNELFAASGQIYKYQVDKFNDLFENLAVCLIFHGGEINNLESKELKEKIVKSRENINRFDVAKLDNKFKFVSFIHTSYAEYLVAEVFLKCHEKDYNCQAMKLNNEQLKRIYFEKEFRETRKHICQILAASPAVKLNCVPNFIGSNKKRFLEVMIEEDCYELYLQIKNSVKFDFKYSIFGFTYFNDFKLLYRALKRASKEFVQQLLKDGAKFEDILNEIGVLHLAIVKGLHQEVQDHFESLKVNMDIKHHGNMPLHFAAQYASRDMVKFLIEKGADVNAKNDSEKTALYFAIEANNAEVCELLIAKGADCTDALNHAAIFGNKQTFNVIHQNTPDEGKEERLREVHFVAAYEGNLEIFKNICGFPEADPQAMCSNGYTFLHCAASRGHLHCMPYIFEYMNQSVDIKNRNGETALMNALAYEEDDGVVEWLLEKNADILAVDDQGISCLHHAAGGGNLHVVKMCLDAGADVNSQDKDGKTALFHATSKSVTEVVEYLLENGANH